MSDNEPIDDAVRERERHNQLKFEQKMIEHLNKDDSEEPNDDGSCMQ